MLMYDTHFRKVMTVILDLYVVYDYEIKRYLNIIPGSHVKTSWNQVD